MRSTTASMKADIHPPMPRATERCRNGLRMKSERKSSIGCQVIEYYAEEVAQVLNVLGELKQQSCSDYNVWEI